LRTGLTAANRNPRGVTEKLGIKGKGFEVHHRTLLGWGEGTLYNHTKKSPLQQDKRGRGGKKFGSRTKAQKTKKRRMFSKDRKIRRKEKNQQWGQV